MQNTQQTDRNYSTISPSARSLLLMKGLTNIPFARQVAEMMNYPEKYVPDFKKKDISLWARVVHFENRYWSVDQLLKGLPFKNILELSSGFSFRGLEIVKQPGFHYIDTDLADVITEKNRFIKTLQNNEINPKSKLEILPLNALDEKQFEETVKRFPEGEIVIVNEGLLMYLNMDEKEKLCGIIHQILKKHGGYWITADIYIKKEFKKLDLKLDEKTKAFFKEHNIEENKFESFKAAEAFFKKVGFIIDKEAEADRLKLSSLKYLMKSANLFQLFKMRKASKIQTTWRLQVAMD